MTSFRLLTYLSPQPRAGLLIGNQVHDAANALAKAGLDDPASTLGLLRQWDRALPAIRAYAESDPRGGVPLDEALLTVPILYPPAFFCIAANYYRHSKEMDPNRNVTREGKQPYFFLKSPQHTAIGPGAAIQLPPVSGKIDWEIELAAVIGKDASQVKAENALDYVAGYTIVNDLSARDLARREDWQFVSDWFGQKMFETAMPFGPWIVPASEIPDPQDLEMKLWVNDELQQHSKTDDMLFSLCEQIEYISSRLKLRPGDVIATGTPSGVGAPRGIFLKSGDVVRMEIAGIGSMTNPVS